MRIARSVTHRPLAGLQRSWHAQQGHLFPWAAVYFGAGVGIYFLWPHEPALMEWGSALSVSLAALFGLYLGDPGAARALLRRAGCVAVLLISVGFICASLRAHLVAAPVLQFRYYGPVEGRLIAVDRSARDALRLTLDQVRLLDVHPEKTPQKIRISARALTEAPQIGARVMTTAHLSPAGGPVEPGGFDFRRHLWFQGIGAVGYTRVPVLLAEYPGDDLRLARFRARITRGLWAALPGEGGAVAAAVLTGDRSGIAQSSVEALRISNLAHLLAISGLHMGLLSGVVFLAARYLLLILEILTSRALHPKRNAALVAMAAASAYLALSGGYVATERAYVMAMIVLGAVVLGRRALTLRAVAIAAFVVLIHRPESLLSPGFQMSFAATTALVVTYGLLRERRMWLGPRWLRPVTTLALTSLVAGLATAPFGAMHFNTLSHYGLLANLLTVPVMGMVVMPAAVLAVVLLPFGMEGAALWIMVQGLEWILGVAHFVAALPDPRSYVAQPAGFILPLASVAALILLLWRGRIRMVGFAGVVAALLLWQTVERPFVLIAEDGGLGGVWQEGQRVLSHARGSGFSARVWLENDGSDLEQVQAAGDFPPVIKVLRGKRAAESFEDCGQALVVSSNQEISLPQGETCLLITPKTLRQSGSISISKQGVITTSRAHSGLRLWSPAIWHKTEDPLQGRRIWSE